jgi:hypothetical protein
MNNPNQHEDLSPEELLAKKEEMMSFYSDSMPYLEAQLKYEKMLADIDEVRFKRTQIQMQYAMMMAPEEEAEENVNNSKPKPAAKPTAKKRVLKTEA